MGAIQYAYQNSIEKSSAFDALAFQSLSLVASDNVKCMALEIPLVLPAEEQKMYEPRW